METMDIIGMDGVILTSYRQNGSTKPSDTAAEVDACRNDLDLNKVKVTVTVDNEISGREDHTADAEQCGCCFYHPQCLQRFAKPVTYVYLYTCIHVCIYMYVDGKSLVTK